MLMMHPNAIRDIKDDRTIIRPVTRYTGYSLVDVLREIKAERFFSEKNESLELCPAFEELVCRAMAGTTR